MTVVQPPTRREEHPLRALYKPSAAPGLELIECPEPVAGPGEVKIRVERTGICGTDLHIESWDAWAASAVNAPLVIGHEFSGRIVELGEGVTSLEVGALVSGEGHVICGTCRNCRAGRRHMCKNTSSVGVNRNGAFADYVVIPASNVWVHSDAVDADLPPVAVDAMVAAGAQQHAVVEVGGPGIPVPPGDVVPVSPRRRSPAERAAVVAFGEGELLCG